MWDVFKGLSAAIIQEITKMQDVALGSLGRRASGSLLVFWEGHRQSWSRPELFLLGQEKRSDCVKEKLDAGVSRA